MAEDDRAIAEGSASWNLQSGMGLHLRGYRLQLSPDQKSGAASDVSQRQVGLAGPEKIFRASQRMQPKFFSKSQNHATGKGSKSRRPFFRSLLVLLCYKLDTCY